MPETKPSLLIVDDKRNMLRLMTKVMKNDAVIRTASNGASALRILASEPVDVVLCDLKMPDITGIEVLKACASLRPDVAFVLMTAYATVGTAVEALKLGAYDYLTKPFEPKLARTVLLRALARTQLGATSALISDEVLPGLIARSAVMQEVAATVRKVAASDATVLILGETGTGKEQIARAVHRFSARGSNRFLAVNCAAIPAELLESELFGHARGAFTGAVAARKGLFEEASGGSLFLDELGDMLPSLQAKLTRVLEERAVRRVGEADERSVNVRLIAATHRDLENMVSAQTFREDLWYRLNVSCIRLPPLRQRREDIEPLALHFLRQQAERVGANRLASLSHSVVEAFCCYDWHGNVRQLRSAVEHACLMSGGSEIELKHLPAELQASGAQGEQAPTLAAGTWAEALERGRAESGRRYLAAVMKRFQGKVSDAAAHAGVERESFYRLLRKHSVDPNDYR